MSSEGGAARGIAGQAARDSRFAGPGLKGTGAAEAAAARDEGHPPNRLDVRQCDPAWLRLGVGAGGGARLGPEGHARAKFARAGLQGEAWKGKPGRASLVRMRSRLQFFGGNLRNLFFFLSNQAHPPPKKKVGSRFSKSSLFLKPLISSHLGAFYFAIPTFAHFCVRFVQ